MTESPTSQPAVTNERLISVLWACLGACCAWTLYSCTMVFVLGHYEHMLGGPGNTFVVMLVAIIVASPAVGIGAFCAHVFLDRVIRQHRARLYCVSFVAGFVVLASAVALGSIHPVEWWEGLCILALATALVQWCMVTIAMKTGLVLAAGPHVCPNCGYNLRGTPHDSAVCPECGAAVVATHQPPGRARG